MCAERKNERGSVLMEAVILLPVVLGAILTAGQFAHIWYARQMTAYAAYAAGREAARSTTAAEAEISAVNAAKNICAHISLTADADSANTDITVPRLGVIPGSRDVDEKMQVTVTESEWTDAERRRTVTVQMDFPLVFPVVNYLLKDGIAAFTAENPASEKIIGAADQADEEKYIFPHIRIRETAIVPVPVKIVE